MQFEYGLIFHPVYMYALYEVLLKSFETDVVMLNSLLLSQPGTRYSTTACIPGESM